MHLKQVPVVYQLWGFLRNRVLTTARFDLFLQGSLLMVILMEHNVMLLLKRDADTGHTPQLIQDWVIIGAAGVEFLLGAFLAWCGRGRRNLALSTWLALTALSGLLVLAFPFTKPIVPAVELCGGQQISMLRQHETLDSSVAARTVFLIATAILCGFAKISIWAHGLTFLDDNEPQNGPYFYGILISIQLSLGLSGKNWLMAGAIRDDWWEAHLSIAMLILMFAILFILFTKKKDGKVQKNEDYGFMSSLRRVLSNKLIVLQVGALGFLNAALFGFFHYDSGYTQARFHVEVIREDLRSPRLVGTIFRPLVIIFFIMIFRVRFSVRRSDGVKANTAARVGGITAVVAAVLFAALGALSCGDGQVSGLDGGVLSPPSCSGDCGCSPESHGFTPVCALETATTYFSPCDAGCSNYEDLNGFLVLSNCTCEPGRMVRGACTLPTCQLVYSIYQVLVTVILAVTGASMLMQGMAVLRAARDDDKPTAMGAMFAIIAVTAHVLGHLLYMLISHLLCALFNEGLCVFHLPSIYIMAAVSAALALLSALVSLIASRLSYSPSSTHNELEGDNEL